VKTGSGSDFKDVSEERAKRDQKLLSKADKILDETHSKVLKVETFAGEAKTLEEVRLAAAETYAPAAMYAYKEAGWLIVELESGGYAFTHAYVTGAGARKGATLDPKLVSSWAGVKNVVEGWHTHWDKNEVFSGQDGFWTVANRRKPLHVINFKGNVRKLNYRNVRNYKAGTTYRMPVTINGSSLDMKVNLKFQ